MTPDDARAALAFLMRAEIKGHEAARFVQVCYALQAEAEKPAEKPKGGK